MSDAVNERAAHHTDHHEILLAHAETAREDTWYRPNAVCHCVVVGPIVVQRVCSLAYCAINFLFFTSRILYFLY